MHRKKVVAPRMCEGIPRKGRAVHLGTTHTCCEFITWSTPLFDLNCSFSSSRQVGNPFILIRYLCVIRNAFVLEKTRTGGKILCERNKRDIARHMATDVLSIPMCYRCARHMERFCKVI